MCSGKHSLASLQQSCVQELLDENSGLGWSWGSAAQGGLEAASCIGVCYSSDDSGVCMTALQYKQLVSKMEH